MSSFKLDEVGVHVGEEKEDSIRFGIYLPNITPEKGYRLYAKIISSKDRFNPGVPTANAELTYEGGDYGLWKYGGSLGQLYGEREVAAGTYYYRYSLTKNGANIGSAFGDPFAKFSGTGVLSSFEYPKLDEFQWSDQDYKTPKLYDLIVYELMVAEFNSTFAGVVEYLPYLKGLGINCIELMPCGTIREPFRWGYLPLSYFSIEEKYGGALELKKLVEACHKEGIAVIHDAVYAHASNDFPYNSVYRMTGEPNPMMGRFVEDAFGVGGDFTKKFTQDFYAAVNDYFLNDLHMDGFRYDYIPGFFDGSDGVGYAKLARETYEKSKSIPRFVDGDISRIIQAAEYLDKPREILRESYSSTSKRWWPMKKAQEMISQTGTMKIPEGFVHDILLTDTSNLKWLETHPVGGFPTAPLQFIESHDQSRLMYFATSAFFREIGRYGATESFREGGLDLLSDADQNALGDRYQDWEGRWYRLQPFAIALMTAEGVPLIWQGQCFGEYYGLPNDGNLRVLAARPLHWDLFYEPGGNRLVYLYRHLATLRHSNPALRSRKSFYFREASRLNEGLLAYRRDSAESDLKVLVLINFGSNSGATMSIPLTKGRWVERLNNFQDETKAEVINLDSDQSVTIKVPSFYGKIFELQA